METHRLVLPEDLNQFGYLFGGRLLSWVDEASWIAATLHYPDCRFVTIGMNEVSFKHSVQQGAIIAIRSVEETRGRTSVGYRVEVYCGRVKDSLPIFSTLVTFVNVDEDGNKTEIVGGRDLVS